MGSPAELDAVRWHTLTHAYGTAENVPGLIRALYGDGEGDGDDGEAVGEALRELYGSIHHQGTAYPASAPAVPFLAHAARNAPGRRVDVLMLLAGLADHDPGDVGGPHWQGSPVAAVCGELCGVLEELLPCLEDASREVRRAALRVVAAVADVLSGEAREAAEHQVDLVCGSDAVPVVRAEALVVLGRLGVEPLVLDESLSGVGPAAAVFAAEGGAQFDADGEDLPWPGTGTRREPLVRLLTRDPDACLAVAARWIAAGDVGARGSWLAEAVAEMWRDREAEVLGQLLAALPHQKNADALAERLRAVTHWITCVAEPDAKLLDALHGHAEAGEDDVAEPALLALVRSGDPRGLELALRRRDGQALAAAAEAFPGAGERLIPAIRRELAAGAAGNDGIALVQALGSFGDAAREAQPEVAECLRSGRAAVVSARRLGLDGLPAPEVVALLGEAAESGDPSVCAAAAVALYRLTGEAEAAVAAFDALLSGRGPVSWHLTALLPLGPAAAPLLPRVEELLTASYEWTRAAAAEAHLRITGEPDRAVPVLSALVGATPVGLRALRVLSTVEPVPDGLRPALDDLASSALRVLTDSPHAGPDHPDRELRTLSRRTLTSTRAG